MTTLPIAITELILFANEKNAIMMRLISKKLMHYFDEHVDLGIFILDTCKNDFTISTAKKIQLIDVGTNHILIKRISNWLVYTDFSAYNESSIFECRYPQDYEYHFLLHFVHRASIHLFEDGIYDEHTLVEYQSLDTYRNKWQLDIEKILDKYKHLFRDRKYMAYIEQCEFDISNDYRAKLSKHIEEHIVSLGEDMFGGIWHSIT